MIATDLISPKEKVVDDIAKLISKSDVSTLTGEKYLVQATAAEQTLSEAWTELQGHSKARELPVGQCNALFGRLSSRVVLFMLKKEKQGPETTEYAPLAAIKAAFTAEKLKDLGQEDEAKAATPAAGTHAASAASSSSNSQEQTTSLSTIDAVSDPVWIAQQKGYVTGKFFTEFGDRFKIFKLESFAATGVSFRQVTLAPVTPEVRSIGFDSLNKWKHFKGKLPVKLDADISEYMADKHTLLKIEAAKAQMFGELMALASEWAEYERENVDFYFNPAEILAKNDIPKGEMWLVPATEIGRASLKSGTSTTLASSDKFKFFLDSPQRPKAPPATDDPWKKDTIMSAYWWVKTSEVQSESNLKVANSKVEQFTSHVLENTKAIKPYDKFVLFVPPKGSAAKRARID